MQRKRLHWISHDQLQTSSWLNLFKEVALWPVPPSSLVPSRPSRGLPTSCISIPGYNELKKKKTFKQSNTKQEAELFILWLWEFLRTITLSICLTYFLLYYIYYTHNAFWLFSILHRSYGLLPIAFVAIMNSVNTGRRDEN